MSEKHPAETLTAAELLWTGRRRPSRGPRPAMTLERILAAGIELADAEGLQALSMKRLAERLDCGTMSLYRYVPGKDELVNLMFDAAIGPPTEDADPTHWRERIGQWARRQREFFQRHPWALSVAVTRRVMGPNELGQLEAALRAFVDTGLSYPEMLDATLLVNGYVRGYAQLADSGPRTEPIDPAWVLRHFERWEQFPVLAALTESERTQQRRYGTASDSFQFGLRRILDGLAVHTEAPE